jgi:hypothetical protein
VTRRQLISLVAFGVVPSAGLAIATFILRSLQLASHELSRLTALCLCWLGCGPDSPFGPAVWASSPLGLC